VFRYSSRFWLYAPLSLFLLLAAAVMIHCWTAAGVFEKKLAALKGRAAVPGITLDWDTVRVSGFPFRLDANFTHLRIAGSAAHGPFAWQSEKFAMHSLTYGRAKAVYEAAGRQRAHWTQADGCARTLNFLPGSMRASSILDGRGLARFDLDIVGLDGQDVAIERFQFHMRRDPDGKDMDLMLKADAVQSSGAKAKNVQLYATLSQSDAWAPLLKGEMSWPQADDAWRARGGQAKFSQVLTAGVSPDAMLSALY
jgi:hypothetical protein